MRQLTKEVYEAPLTTKRVVTMESSCMAASGDKINDVVNKNDVQLNISDQSGADGFSVSGSWTTE